MEYLGLQLAVGMILALSYVYYQCIIHKYVEQLVTIPAADQWDMVHNQFIFNLALEVEENRQKQQDENDELRRQQLQQAIELGGTELVDTILAMHGIDMHGEESDDNVLYFEDFIDHQAR